MWVSLRKRKPVSDPDAGDERGHGQDPAGEDVAGVMHPEVAAGQADQEGKAEQPWREGWNGKRGTERD